MKALSVKQPWASLIASGAKTVELRTRRMSYRGPLLIVSSKAADSEGLRHYDDGPRSQAVTIVDVVDCRPATRSDSRAACCPVTDGEFAIVLANPRPVTSSTIRGQLGLYDVDDRLVRLCA